MTTKDKTRQRLVGSMRKTKVVAGIGTENAEPEASVAAIKATQAANPTAAKPARGTQPAAAEPVAGDSYQSGRRIWPD
jgi:hypothetical protein